MSHTSSLQRGKRLTERIADQHHLPGMTRQTDRQVKAFVGSGIGDDHHFVGSSALPRAASTNNPKKTADITIIF